MRYGYTDIILVCVSFRFHACLFLSLILACLRFSIRSGKQFWFVSMSLVLGCVQTGFVSFFIYVHHLFSIDMYVSAHFFFPDEPTMEAIGRWPIFFPEPTFFFFVKYHPRLLIGRSFLSRIYIT